MWKRNGRSSALERARAVLSCRKDRGTAAHSSIPPRASSPQELSDDLLSLHSGLSQSPDQGHTFYQPDASHVPKPKADRPIEVSSLNTGASRFLKKTAAAATQDKPEERVVSSSLRASQTAAPSALAQIENRYKKDVQKRSPSRVGPLTVHDVPEEQSVVARPCSDQPRRFVKSGSHHVLKGDGPQGQSDASDHTAQECFGRRQLQSPFHISTPSPQITSLVQAQTPPELSRSPPSRSPSPPDGRLSSSADSACVAVRSLDELFSQDEISETTSDHFQIHVMEIDELEPASLLEESADVKEMEEDLQPVEEDYPSDFESVIQTESLSEPTHGRASPHSELSQDSARLSSPPLSEHIEASSPPLSRHTGASSPPLSRHTGASSPPFSELSYSKTSTKTSSSAKSEARPPEASVRDTRLPRSKMPYVKGRPGQTLHMPAHSGYSPSLQILMESLRQQLDLASQFISSSQEHHARILRSLGPPDYTYTTLEDTQKNIRKIKSIQVPRKAAEEETTPT